MLVIESTGRKLKDAIDNGLAQLGKSLAEVEVEVLDNGGLFRKAKVRITVPGEDPAPVPKKEEPTKVFEPKVEKNATEKHEKPIKANKEVKENREDKNEEKVRKEQKVHREQKTEQRERKAVKESKEPKESKEKVEQTEEVIKEPRHYDPVTPEVVKKSEDFVTNLIEKMGIDAKIATEVEEGRLKINLTTENSSAIGYHGEVLDSIEYLTNYVINHDKFYHVIVDCNDYREKRKESLIALANKMAAKCLKVRHKISLEPMNSNERKIIHSALADNEQVITRSEGHEPNRHVVILCKKR